MAKIVIIGAGLTGISAAYHLEQKGYYDYALFEKNDTIGGLCGTVFQDGFTFDYTGHYLHISDAYFGSMIEQLVGMENLNTVHRKSFIYSHDTYTKYPFQINLQGLPPRVIAECISGFVTRKKTRKKPETFNDWVMQSFGKGFGKYFFNGYQKKIFGYDLKKITASWTGRFVPTTSLEQIIRGSLYNYDDAEVGYNATFLYPKHGGIVSWVQKIADHIKNPIATNMAVTSINAQNKTVTFANGHIEPYQHLITTMPLDHLLKNMQEKSSNNLAAAANKLICNSVINFNLGISRPNLSDKHWIYFPENQYPFYRLGFPFNSAQSMAPAGCSSIYGEFSHVNKSPAWIKKTLEQSLAQTKKLFKLDDREIITQKIMPISHAYVIYDQWRETHLPKIQKNLEEQAIYSIGRYGHWKYSSMQEAVLDGKKVVEKLLVLPARHIEKESFVQITPRKQPSQPKEL